MYELISKLRQLMEYLNLIEKNSCQTNNFLYVLLDFAFRCEVTIDGRVNSDCRNTESMEFNDNEYDEYRNDDC